MSHKVEICNLSLRTIGEDRIMSIDEDSESARILQDVYDLKLEQLLSAHPWKFATKRGSLARLDETPSFGYTYAYQLPSDCIRVLRMEDLTTDFTIEGNKLLTDEATAKIKYIARITDPVKYTPEFVKAFAALLAYEICYQITNDARLTTVKEKEYEQSFEIAKSIDAQSGGVPETADADSEYSWLDDRG